MKINLLFTGKTKIQYIDQGVTDYFARLKHYIPIDIIIVPDLKKVKNLSESEIKKKEGEGILKALPVNSIIVLLDERGKEYSSVAFSEFINKKLIESRDLCFVVGGAYGFSEEVYQKASAKISLSKLTFSHQMIRMIIAEQLYRAFTILRNEPYHHN
ncbi:MAG: 23S rRNA (pseudouridine(1915)-N(3))-methyltransferase RlmH [Bacteroidales bacterium]|nr:23S rRNA (pseudouridine(1915)-N(3))-methyltransferase RlmH [Bacteroidales bacterium]MCF8389954.1 23S rRNA (pseudouridine(1915)-N(3))-methyltransferase RlmH [Bacteroidales bacterium]